MKKYRLLLVCISFFTLFFFAHPVNAACQTSGIPTAGNSCCSGYIQEARSGACIPVGATNNNPGGNAASGGGGSSVCDSIGNPSGCSSCNGDGQVWTALGCLDVSSGGFAKTIFNVGIAIGSMLAFMLVLFGALQMMMSAGNPEKLNEGKELVTAAVIGLLFIIFSVFLLRIIGVDILGIPKFS